MFEFLKRGTKAAESAKTNCTEGSQRPDAPGRPAETALPDAVKLPDAPKRPEASSRAAAERAKKTTSRPVVTYLTHSRESFWK